MAVSLAEQRGKTYALTNWARCHSIDRVTQSPLKIAPPFRTIHLRYPVETLGEALAEGIYTGHPTMPAFELDPGQIHDLLSYLKSLE
jgi:cytochrome c